MKFRAAVTLVTFLLLSPRFSFAQLEASNWRFSKTTMGLHFSPSGVVTVTNDSYTPHGNEGCAVLSDPKTGNLKFYTDGMIVVDAGNQPMPNGTGLIGHSSSLNSGKIATDPSNCQRFYIFHTNSAFENGPGSSLYYSIVDMTLPGNGTAAAPKGDVVATSKNIEITQDVGEAIEVVPIANTHDFWLLVGLNSSNSIKVYKFSLGGSTLINSYPLSYYLSDMRPMRFCKKNGKLALGSTNDYDPVLIINFDAATGTLSNEISVPGIDATNGMYNGVGSLCWSPDAKKLYISKYRHGSSGGKLYQYDLQTTALNLIYDVDNSSPALTARGLKVGPDGKMYFLYGNNNGMTQYIGVINNPNNDGAACNFNPTQVDMGAFLQTANCFPDFLYTNDTIKKISDTTFAITFPCSSTKFSIDTTFNLALTAIDIDKDNLSYSIMGNSSASAIITSTNTGIHYKNTATPPYSDTITIKYCDDYCVAMCKTFKVIIEVKSLSTATSHLPPVLSSCAGNILVLDAGSGLVNYKWSTGETTPSIQVTTSGTYKITANDLNGCPISDSTKVLFHPLPLVHIGNDTTVCDSLVLKTGKNFPAIKWSNGATTASNTVHASGIYNVMVTDQYGCIGGDTISVTLGTAPIIDIGGPFNFCGNAPINQALSVPASLKALWSTGSTDNTIVVHATGTYAVTVTDINGCKSTDQAIVLAAPAPVAAFVHGDSMCRPALFNFNDRSTLTSGSIKNWKWDLGNGSTAQVPDIMSTYAEAGTYTVKLVVTSAAGCSDSITHTVTVLDYPHTDFITTQLCKDATIQLTDQTTAIYPIKKWSWNFGDGNVDVVNQNPLHTYTQPGTYKISLTTSTLFGCVQLITKQVTVLPKPVANFSTANVCDGKMAVFTDKSISGSNVITSTSWSFGDDTPLYTGPNPTHVYIAPNTYYPKLIIHYNKGCVDSVTKKIIVNPNPKVNFDADPLKGCSPLAVDFKDVSTIATGKIIKWFWETGTGTSTSKNPETVYKNTGSTPRMYDVKLTVTSDSGCIADLVKKNYITVYPSPVAAFSLTPKITSLSNAVITFKNNSTGTDSALWDFGDQSTSEIYNTAPHTYLDSGKYVVKLIVYSAFGCSDSTFHEVMVQPEFSFYVPNAFTPNGDETNNTFSGKGIYISEYEMQIFDRWGNLMFRTDDIRIPWDGSKNNKTDIAAQDVYIYKIHLTDSNKKTHSYIGTVTLVR